MNSATLFSLIVLISSVMAVVGAASAPAYNSTGFFSLKYRFAGKDKSLSALKAHDTQRQLRFLAGVDLPLGGIGRPNAVGYEKFISFLELLLIDYILLPC